MIKAVIYDLDDTMVNSDPLHKADLVLDSLRDLNLDQIKKFNI